MSEELDRVEKERAKAAKELTSMEGKMKEVTQDLQMATQKATQASWRRK